MQTQGKFVVFALDEFAAWLANRTVSRAIALIQDHHTFLPDYAGFRGDNHFALLAGMERAHLERGFAEIAQNLTIFPDGAVALCRDLDKTPAGIKGANANGVCLENLGNFDAGRDSMTEAQRGAIVGVNALLCRKFGLVPGTDTLVYHHWYDLNTGQRTDGAGVTKSCPGTAFFGGNTVAAAAAGFVPLVARELERLGAGQEGSHDTAALPKARVTAAALNVRAGAGASFKRVGTLTPGTVVAVFEERGGWLRVAPAERWVSERFVERLP